MFDLFYHKQKVKPNQKNEIKQNRKNMYGKNKVDKVIMKKNSLSPEWSPLTHREKRIGGNERLHLREVFRVAGQNRQAHNADHTSHPMYNLHAL